MTVTCEQVTGKYKVVIPCLLLETFLLPFQFTLSVAQTVYAYIKYTRDLEETEQNFETVTNILVSLDDNTAQK
jgi:hypothetical protein